FSDAVDPSIVCCEAIDYWSETMNKFLRERDRLADNRICDIQYEEVCREPIRAVRRIYEFFGWSLSKEAEQSMRVLIASQAKRKNACEVSFCCRAEECVLVEGRLAVVWEAR